MVDVLAWIALMISSETLTLFCLNKQSQSILAQSLTEVATKVLLYVVLAMKVGHSYLLLQVLTWNGKVHAL